jgi:hypothetical protein
VKVGDLVKLTASGMPRLGVVIGIAFKAGDWYTVARLNGQHAIWPKSQMEVISESR